MIVAVCGISHSDLRSGPAISPSLLLPPQVRHAFRPIDPDEYDAVAAATPHRCPLRAAGDPRCGRALLADAVADAAQTAAAMAAAADGQALLEGLAAALEAALPAHAAAAAAAAAAADSAAAALGFRPRGGGQPGVGGACSAAATTAAEAAAAAAAAAAEVTAMAVPAAGAATAGVAAVQDGRLLGAVFSIAERTNAARLPLQPSQLPEML